jgi:hypothetical protein
VTDLAIFDPIAPTSRSTGYDYIVRRERIPVAPVDSPAMVALLATYTAQTHVHRSRKLASIAQAAYDKLRRDVANQSAVSRAAAVLAGTVDAHKRARFEQANAQQQLANAVQAAEGITDEELRG